MDSTHGISSYKYNITTLMYVDDLNHGIPAAVMISKRVNSKNMRCFIRKITQVISTKR